MATTPKRVTDLLKEEIPAKISLNQFCKKTGINPNSVDKYMAGVTEPTQASLQKLSDYFGVTVAELRGETKPDWFEDGTFKEELWKIVDNTIDDLIKKNPNSSKQDINEFLQSMKQTIFTLTAERLKQKKQS